eukprot:3835538-Rhodomonas_salina.2
MPYPNRVFLSKFPAGLQSNDLQQYFSQFGEVVDVYIPMNPATQKPKGIAFIAFETAEMVDACCAVAEHVINGEALELRKADPKPDSRVHAGGGPNPFPPFDGGYMSPQRGGNWMPGPPGPRMPMGGEWGRGGGRDFGGGGRAPRAEQRFRIFVRTVPDQVNQEQLRTYFEKFGEVTDVYLPSHNGPDGPKRKGFGYITFKSEHELESCL